MIVVENLHLDLGRFRLQDVNLVVEDKEYVVIMGPSGAGKTVLLMTILGLYRPSSGRILIDYRDVTYEPPERRNLAYVPQDYALFPHMTVYDNIAYGLRARRVPELEVRRRVKWIAEVLGIDHLLSAKPHTLSGGEKQRVALARALVVEPKAILLDEPTAALDPELRSRARRFIRELHRKLGFTAIHVTHDLTEALVLATKAAFMSQGRILISGHIDEVIRSPYLGQYAEDLNIVDLSMCPKLAQALGVSPMCRAIFRPEDVVVTRESGIDGLVLDLDFKGPLVLLKVRIENCYINAYVTRSEWRYLGINMGSRITVNFIRDNIRVYCR